ncbi:MAG TPA: DUF5658 family protein [Bryobacteraceae bacterium]|nr:DUF5658 family protein [Bryobacteraceae bacterium]
MLDAKSMFATSIPGDDESARFIQVVEVFLYVQLLDVLTTMIGLYIGLGEASPFIRQLMRFGPHAGLLGSKVIAVLLGALCVWKRRLRVIKMINYWYAALVVWNLQLILAVLSSHRAL